MSSSSVAQITYKIGIYRCRAEIARAISEEHASRMLNRLHAYAYSESTPVRPYTERVHNGFLIHTTVKTPIARSLLLLVDIISLKVGVRAQLLEEKT